LAAEGEGFDIPNVKVKLLVLIDLFLIGIAVHCVAVHVSQLAQRTPTLELTLDN
jgi:hypothetical protein